MNWISRRNVLKGAAAALALPAIGRPAHAQGAGPLRIGVIQTLSGTGGEPGRDQVMAMELAVAQFNAAGGWNGRMAELVVRDDRLKADDAVALTRELQGSGINLMFGCLFTGPALACMPIIKPLDVVYFTSGPSGMSLTHELYVPNLFRVCANAYMAYRAEAKVLAERYPNITKWTSIVADTQGTRDIDTIFRSSLREFYKSMHGKDVELSEAVLVKAGTTDFRNQVNTVLSSGAEGLLLGVFAGDALTFIQQARPFGLLDQVKALGDISLNVNMGRALKKNTPEDVWSVMTWQELGFKDVPKVPAFLEGIRAKAGDPTVNQFHAQAHCGLDMMLQAVVKANSSATSAVIAALEDGSYGTVYGPMGFRKEDHQAQMNPGMVRMGPANSEAGWEVREFVPTPWQDAIEPASPGKVFEIK